MNSDRPECPHCHGWHTSLIARLNDDVRGTRWLQCDDCRRVWSVTRPPPSSMKPPENENSPES